MAIAEKSSSLLRKLYDLAFSTVPVLLFHAIFRLEFMPVNANE